MCIILSLLVFSIVNDANILIASKETDLFWRDYKHFIPSDAVPTGHDTYIAQVVVNRCGLVPATLYPHKKAAVAESNMKRFESKSNIKVLCSTQRGNFKWVYVNVESLNNKTLEKCVPGGYEYGSPVYIGKVFHEGEWKIGKVFPATSKWKGLRVWYNSGQVYQTVDFQIFMFDDVDDD